MRSLNPHIGAMAAMVLAASPGLLVASGAMEIMERPGDDLQPMRRRPAQTNTVNVAAEPQVWVNELVNTRQVRRQRERLAAKGHTDYPVGGLAYRGNNSRYMPHIGAKERGRYAS